MKTDILCRRSQRTLTDLDSQSKGFGLICIIKKAKVSREAKDLRETS